MLPKTVLSLREENMTGVNGVVHVTCRYDLAGHTVSEVRKELGLGEDWKPYVSGGEVEEFHLFDGWNLEFRR